MSMLIFRRCPRLRSRWLQGLVAALLSALLLTACTTQVEVNGHFPDPLRPPLPFAGTLVVEERLQKSTYRAPHGKTVEVAIGAAQSRMFETVTPRLFQSFEVSDDLAAALAQQPDLTLVPELREFQIATPADTQLKIFEVWLRYLIQVYDRDGQLLLTWPIAAYGKTQDQFMKSDEDALNQAAMVALRDAGARLALEFEHEPLIQRWMRQTLHQQRVAGQEAGAASSPEASGAQVSGAQ